MSEYWTDMMRTLNPPPRQPRPPGSDLAHIARTLDFAMGGPMGMVATGGKGGKTLVDLIREASQHPDWKQGVKMIYDALSPAQPPRIRELLNQEAARIYFHHNPLSGHTPMPLTQFSAEGKLIPATRSVATSPTAAAPVSDEAFKAIVGRSVTADNDFFQQAKAQWLASNPGKDPTGSISDIARLATDLKIKGGK